jgi:hypothetical protein
MKTARLEPSINVLSEAFVSSFFPRVAQVFPPLAATKVRRRLHFFGSRAQRA